MTQGLSQCFKMCHENQNSHYEVYSDWFLIFIILDTILFELILLTHVHWF